MPDSPNDLVPRVAVLEQSAGDTREAFSRIERRFDAVDARIDKLGTELRGEIASVRPIRWTTSLWLLALLIGTFGGLLGVVAKGSHWL